MPPSAPAAQRQPPDILEHIRKLLDTDALRTPTSAQIWLLRQLAGGDALLTNGATLSLRSGRCVGQRTARAVVKAGWATMPARDAPLFGEAAIPGVITQSGRVALDRS